MEKLKKFNAKDYCEHLRNSVKEMNAEDAYILSRGIYLLWKNFNNYYSGKYGSPKRLTDLFEYITVIQNSYLKKLKEEEELPY